MTSALATDVKLSWKPFFVTFINTVLKVKNMWSFVSIRIHGMVYERISLNINR